MKSSLDRVLNQHHHIWRGDSRQNLSRGLATGFAVLDQALPTQGWPEGALVEMVVPYWGLGELRLLLPAMADLNRNKRRVVWIAPPYLPYAPALAQAGLDLHYVMVIDAQAGNVSWAMERVLSTPSCGMVLAWPTYLSEVETRRLQLAAEVGTGTGVVMHTLESRWRARQAALRLELQTHESGVTVDIVKARGGCRHPRVSVDL